MSRPSSQHRVSVGSTATSLPHRSPYNRTHSYNASAGSLAGSNRISRRKSSTFSPAAHQAVLSSAMEHAVAEGSVPGNRRSSMSRTALAALNDGGHPSSLPQQGSMPERDTNSAVTDGPSLSSFQGVDRAKARMRRASDGTRLTKKEKAATGDLKWEHTPQWQQTSKFLISKHQQVQMLEAASVLVAMTGEAPGTTDSDNSSSPAASGSSERDDEPSSAETTPPPHADMAAYRDSKRYSGTSSAYSRSYQSVFSESAPNEHGFGHHRGWSSSSNRPLTAATSIAESYKDEDPADLAAAVGLLSCSWGTPNQRAANLPNDIPPVPPLPEKYANFSSYRRQTDVEMEDDDESSDDEPPQRMQPNDEDVEMFGKMDA
ncbi:uncharacterized protein LTR77_002526 [Saxophila tyrrhenica]|uniref:Uncharacterized protein n=1 Tax=Saxophila tyrrhenica TaxID=1690608 RepID=A0AAV9PLY5_9PEZI|nr:hypothetical protein LTR77_002526 [Saxophila tyrrhenica]